MNKSIPTFLVFFFLINIATAITTYEETSTVSRIVGESPTEMLRQMQRNEIELGHATYYSHDQFNNKKDNILAEQFGSNLDKDLWNWDFDDVKSSVNGFGNNELFVLETEGGVDTLYAKAGSDKLYPSNLKDWQLSFETNNPLMIWDSPYAGSYLPKEDTFVSRLVRDSTIIAPTSFNSQQFTKSFLCQLVDDKTIGEAFKDARNFHYNGGSSSSGDNLIGLVLQSYALYGNPRQVVNMDFDKGDREKIRKYCNNLLENLAPDIEFLEQIGNYSKFRKHLVFEIPSYTIDNIGDFSIINAENAFQNLEFSELVMPVAVRTTHFPTNTVITNFSLNYVNDFVDLNVNNLASYESDFVNRTCYYDYKNYTIDFESAYAENSLDFVAKINPVEVINCTEGKFRLYKKFNYSVDYIALSPILIKNVNAPILLSINSVANVSIELLPLTNNITNGSLAIFDQNNNNVWEEETTTNITDYNASFIVPSEEGIYKYSVEFIVDNKTLNYDSISLFAVVLEPRANIPVSLIANPDIGINFYSYSDKDFDLNAKYYLTHGNDILEEGEFTKALIPGNNLHQLSFFGLARENQSYTLTFELNYLGQDRTISYILTTNNAPVIYAATGAFKEGEKVVITYTDLDYDGDNLTIGINDSRFTQNDSSFEWQTDTEDEGVYDILLTATDGLLSSNHAVTVNVENSNQAYCDGQVDGGCESLWVLHLVDMPYYVKENNHFSGAASAKMILDFLRTAAGNSTLSQQEIYDYARTFILPENKNIDDLDPKAMDYVIGHYDPYDTLDPSGQGDAYRGYNFNIEAYYPDKDPQALNKYMRDILHWMAYNATIGQWYDDGPLAAESNIPAALPIFGDYNHWVVVNGGVASENPVPSPRKNPWLEINFTVYGYWLTDPVVGGIGQNVYINAQEAASTYFIPVISNDSYNAGYIQIAEPPPVMSTATIKIAPFINPAVKGSSKIFSSNEDIIYAKSSIVSVQDNLITNWEQIIDPALLKDKSFINAFKNKETEAPIKVHRIDTDDYYYIIPFGEDKNTITATIILDNTQSFFKQASWTGTPQKYLPIRRDEAISLVEEALGKELGNSNAELIWQPKGFSPSPFKPYWKVEFENQTWFVTQEKRVIPFESNNKLLVIKSSIPG